MKNARLSTITLLGLLLTAFLLIAPTVASAALPRLAASDGGYEDLFGSEVAISGNSAIIGVPWGWGTAGEKQGSAYIFTGSGGSWTQQAKLVAADGADYQWFGSSVAISGDTALVGTHNGSSVYVFTRSGDVWSQRAELTVPGVSLGGVVALDGDTALLAGNGSVYVFTGSGGDWTQVAKLSAADGVTSIGTAVALDGNVAVVGAKWYSGGQGAAYVFERSGDIWSQTAVLTEPNPFSTAYFGTSVAVSGDSIIVGREAGVGQACVFTRSGGSWNLEATLTALDGTPYAEFGYAVALDGDTAVVGAPWWNGNGVPANSHGAAYVFIRSAGVWTQRNKMTVTAFDSWFGASVAVSQGQTALVGAPYDDVNQLDQGSAWVYAIDPPIPPDTAPPSTSSNAVAYYATSAVINLSATDNIGGSGVAHTYYRLDGGVQTEGTVVSVSAVGSHTLEFWSVDVAGNIESPDNAAIFSITAPIMYTLTYTASTGGTISGTSPQTVNYNSSGTAVTAVPNAGYHFVRWSDGLAAAARTDSNVTADKSVTAEFAINTYTLTYAASSGGTISGASPQTVNYNGSGTAITVVPATGYHFVRWSDGVTTATRTDTGVVANITATAEFAINTYVLTYAAGSGGTISGTSPQTVAYNGSGTAVAAVANAGYHFVGWSDGGATATRTESGVVANITVSAIFAVDAPDTRTLVYTAGSGGTISGTSPQTVVVGGSGSAVTAVANTGYHFVRWSDGKTTAARTDSNVTTDKSVSAQFSIDTHQLTYAAGTGGTISGTSPQTVNYNSSGTAVTAVPNAGYHFVRWSDGLAAAARTDGNVTADKSVTAEFALDAMETRTLTYLAGTGGTISGTSPQTVAPGGSGTAVTAVPTTGYHFVSWSDGATTATRTDLVVLSDLTVTATFARNPLPKATVYTPHAPSTMYRNHHYTIYGYVAPRHTSGTYLVTLKFYLRNSHGVYVYHHSVKARRYYYSTTKTKYKATVSLPHKGRWRVRAYHSDAGHAPSYSGYDYITVK